MWKYFVTLVIAPQIAAAGSVELIPTLDSVHVVQGLWQDQPVAADKFQKALVMQTGFEKDYNNIRDNTNQQLSAYGDRATNSTIRFIDNDTPLSSKAVAITGAVAYTLAVSKSYTQNLGDPFFNGMKHTITISPNNITTGISYSF